MKPATDWKETVSPDESERFERYAEELRDMARKVAAKSGRKSRALHAKGNLGLLGELTVLPDLPEHARSPNGAPTGAPICMARSRQPAHRDRLARNTACGSRFYASH